MKFRFQSWATLRTSQWWAKLSNHSFLRAIMTGTILWWWDMASKSHLCRLSNSINFLIFRFSNMDCSKLKCSLRSSPNELWFPLLLSHICTYLVVHHPKSHVFFDFFCHFLIIYSRVSWPERFKLFLFHRIVSTLYFSFSYWQCILIVSSELYLLIFEK